MNRNRIVVLVVALVCVGGLALAAATVSTPTSSSPDSGSGGGGTQAPPDNGSQGQDGGQSNDAGLPEPLLYLGAVVALLGLLLALRLFADAFDIRRAAVVVIALAIVFVIGMLVLTAILDISAYLDAGSGVSKGFPNQTGNGTGSGDGGRTPTQTPSQSTDTPILLLGFFGVIVLLLALAIYRFSGSDTDVDISSETEAKAETDTESIQAVGEAAGRAADQLDSGTVENAIFQAWQEMTDALDVEQPRTTTPEEFAEIAIDAGMDPDDVRELTGLFEEVRYGDAPVTDDREQRARDALRRIQDTYAGGDHDV